MNSNLILLNAFRCSECFSGTISSSPNVSMTNWESFATNSSSFHFRNMFTPFSWRSINKYARPLNSPGKRISLIWSGNISHGILFTDRKLLFGIPVFNRSQFEWWVKNISPQVSFSDFLLQQLQNSLIKSAPLWFKLSEAQRRCDLIIHFFDV